MLVCHSCDVRNCVNPAHLFLGTHQDNMDDMRRKGRTTLGRAGLIGEHHHKAKLTEAQVREIRAALGTQVEIAKRFGVGRSTIGDIRSGKLWTHI
jgi:DNA invertase Pin-like site-specific DNA recombinase